MVGTATLLGLFAPPPWRSLLPRAFDVALRASVFRTGYELFYTPLAEATKRAAKSIIDVAGDSLGKGAGAALIVLLTRIGPGSALLMVGGAAVLAAAAELVVARRLRAEYVRALEGDLVRQGADLEQAAQLSLSDFTAVGSLGGLDESAVLRAVRLSGGGPEHPADPVLVAIGALRSGDLPRIRAALRQPPSDPLIVGALIPLLAHREVLRPVVTALAAFGQRAAGQLVDALLDPATPEDVRRRLPLVLKSCASSLARDGLVQALASPHFEVRLRSGRALLTLTDDHPELTVPPAVALASLERELVGPDEPSNREHVFNLLVLALERRPARIAVRAFEAGDQYVRGTALEYLETVLPPALFVALKPRVAGAATSVPPRRGAAEVRAELLDAGETMRMSALEARRQVRMGRRNDDA
jgi:hypothetical protein